MSFTKNQLEVINSDGENLVVTASAGSGKTSVMIERIIKLILDGKAEIGEILAVTFTKLAAGEMKEKIAKAIAQAITEENAEVLKRQLDNLSVASISTVHSFCSSLIRKYFFALDVDPNFKVADENDAKTLKARAMNDVFEKLYDENNEDIKRLLAIYLSYRTDDELRGLVEKVYSFAVSEENPHKFLDDSLKAYTKDGVKAAENRLIAAFRQKYQGFANSMELLSQKAFKYNITKFSTFFASISAVLRELANAKTSKDFCEILQTFSFRKPTIKKDEATPITDELSEQYSSLMPKLKKFNERCEKVMSLDEETCIIEAEESGVVLQSLINVVKLFEKRYAELKNELTIVDFSDLEHLTLKLLESEEILSEIKGEYKYIFVDEYQDTNGVQEAIFNKISNNNLFIVGDIKQSIYGFRGCNPEIFKAKIDACSNGYGKLVSLDSNFRSSPKVVETVNNVFSAVMTKDESGVDYASSPMLYGGLYGDFEGEAVLHVVEQQEKTVTSQIGVYSVNKHLAQMKETSVDSEARAIGDIVQEEINRKFYDVKAKCERQVTFGDIAILTSVKIGVIDRIVAELASRGLPVVSESKRSIKDYPEIGFMISLLEYIVCPTSDIALATVLKSPVGGFNENELAEIRKGYKNGTFFDACENARTKNIIYAERLRVFFDYFEKIRVLCQFETAAVVLKKIIVEKDYENFLLSSKLGVVKLNRVNRFISACVNLSVFDYFERLENMLPSMTISAVSGDNAVRVMSCHGSKGLEFPIVILAEIDKLFNTDELSKKIILDRQCGIGIKHYDVENKIVGNTYIYEAIRLKKFFEIPTEQMRLFYVAMTRAKARLHLVAKKMPAPFHSYEDYALASRFSDFLCAEDLTVKNESISSSEAQEYLERREPIISAADETLVENIKEFLGFDYPYQSDTTLPLKRSVSEVLQDEAINVVEDEPYVEDHAIFTAPTDEVGTAYHKILQLADFSKPIKEQFEKMRESGDIDEKTAEIVDLTQLEKIMKMPIFEKINNCKIYREQPFILLVPASLVSACETEESGVDNLLIEKKQTTSQEKVLVQGVIDCLVVNKQGAFIIDYKFSKKSDEALKRTYKKQLELYAYAVENILKTKVLGKYLVNIRLCSQIEV